jgi:hypothetical protein
MNVRPDRSTSTLGRALAVASFGDLLAVLEGLLPNVCSVLLDFVCRRTHVLVFDARGRQQHADQEACRDRAHGQPKRVLLRDPYCFA